MLGTRNEGKGSSWRRGRSNSHEWVALASRSLASTF